MNYTDRERERIKRAIDRNAAWLHGVLLAIFGVELARFVLDFGHYAGWW